MWRNCFGLIVRLCGLTAVMYGLYWTWYAGLELYYVLTLGSDRVGGNPIADAIQMTCFILVGLGVIRWAERIVEFTYRRDGPRCVKCGYDLRATPERCPECGTAR